MIPTRWGTQLNGNGISINGFVERQPIVSPHSLGNPIEWKLEYRSKKLCSRYLQVPTRWGTQLNGNPLRCCQVFNDKYCPHSLGNPIEWKRSLYATS